jgi:HEAT repeat protein
MCALDAIGKIGAAECADAILPLLREHGDVRDKATATLSTLGPRAIERLKDRLVGKDSALKTAIIKLIVNNWSKDTPKSLFPCLFDKDFEIVRFVCDAVRAQSEKMKPPERADLFKEAAEFLALKKAQKDKSALIAGIRLLGYSRQAKAKTLLLKFAQPKNDASVRRHAIVSLRNLEYPDTGNDDMLKAMVGFLGEKDFQNIVSAALEVLKLMKIPEKLCRNFIKLLKSEHSPVRLFAIGVLGQCDSAEAAKALSDLADEKDQAIRDAAAAALAKNPAAVSGLIKRLQGASTVEDAWATAKILRGHAEHLKGGVIKVLTSRMFQLLEKQSDLYRPYYFLLSSVAAGPTFSALFDRGIRNEKAKKFAMAERYLQLIPDAPSSPPEAKYYLASVRLKLSAKGLAKADRDRDVCLKQFADLARKEGFDLLARVRKDPVLDASDLLYLGFHFVEQSEPIRKVGRDILTHVARKWPKTKMAKDARAKLETEAAPPAPAADVPEAIKRRMEARW